MKFTILTACYNKQKFIKQCIDNVTAQKYDNWELIVVDDCSTDGSFDILSTYQDGRIKIIQNSERKLCSSTYAEALKHATGDICGILDGDDVLDEKAMSVVAKRYRDHPKIDFVYTQHHWCDVNLNVQRSGLSARPRKRKSLAQMAKAGRHCFSHWRTFRLKLARKGIIFPEGLEVSVDKNMGFALEELGRGAFLAKRLYYYRYYRGNMSLVQGGNQKSTTKAMAIERIRLRSEKGITVYPVDEIQ